jgi:ribosomal subunit interface protein
VDIVVRGRRCEVPDRFREHVADKLAPVERLAPRVLRIDVELAEETNPRRADERCRIEITVASKGPVVRAEAAAGDRYAALDMAVQKLTSRLRRQADRRRVHHGSRTPVSVAQATADLAPRDGGPVTGEPDFAPAVRHEGSLLVEGDGPVVVREKAHQADPMGLDQALYEMELVGHDFYLFVDAESGRPSVVYRRRGFDYGVIRLVV